MRAVELIAETVEDRPESRELFCKDFDLSCFEVRDARYCKLGKRVTIQGVPYFAPPVLHICPMCDQLSE